jgi:hypothetical protein
MEAFESFQKIARFSRDCVITEKIDGTNGQIYITEDLRFYAGSRNQWILTPDLNAFDADPFGFARWALLHKDELIAGLGIGRHFGEWWGAGIQRRYGLQEKRFSLFNTHRWADDAVRPKCCHVVPVLYEGAFDSLQINVALDLLAANGSKAAPGFMKPEGIVIFHKAANVLFKKTIEKDEEPKGNWKEKQHAGMASA